MPKSDFDNIESIEKDDSGRRAGRRNPNRQRAIVVDWGEVKQRFIASVVDRKGWATQRRSGSRLESIARDLNSPVDGFSGNYIAEDGERKTATGLDACEWVRYGFHSPAFENIAERIPVGKQRRASWNEEDGDIEISRLYGGYDDFYLGMDERIAKPGVRIQFGYAFSCGVPNELIAQYGAWIMALIAGMEANGFDMTVDAAMSVTELFQGEQNVKSHVMLRVKREGEISDPAEWSVLFSPVGFRVLGFAAYGIAGDKLNKVCQSNLGYPAVGNKWDLQYNTETSTVSIMCNSSAYGREDFPAEVLTRKAIEAGLLPDPEGEE